MTLADVSGHWIGPAHSDGGVPRTCGRTTLTRGPHVSGDAGESAAGGGPPDGRFITMVNVLIDGSGGRWRCCPAGHGPIVLYVKATGVESDRIASVAAGGDARVGDGPAAARLSRTMCLALVTDGIVEWAREGARAVRRSSGERLHASLSGTHRQRN